MNDSSPTEEVVKPESGVPLKVSQLRWKLGHKAKREPQFRFLRTRSQRHCRQLGGPSLYHALKAKGLSTCELNVVNSLRMPMADGSSESRMW